MHAPKARTLRSVRSVNRHAPVAAIYDFNFSVPAGTEFCEAAVKWKSVADFYPQGVRGIRKAAKLPTAAQVPRTARNKFKSVFRRDMCALQRGFSCPLRGNSPSVPGKNTLTQLPWAASGGIDRQFLPVPTNYLSNRRSPDIRPPHTLLSPQLLVLHTFSFSCTPSKL